MARKAEDRTGKRYGRLVAMRRGENLPDGRVTWDCECDCGKIKNVPGNSLSGGNTRSCGCLVKDTRVSPINDLTGQRFGRLVVLRLGEGRTINGGVRWICLCDCGKEKQVNGASMVVGNTRSCGCLHADVAAKRAKHGLSGSPIYRSWMAMKARCLDPNNARYVDYGGRGIMVCEEWREDFRLFYAYVGDRPAGTSLDRINVNGNYEPGNVRWATDAEQRANMRPRVSNAQHEEVKSGLSTLLARIENLEAQLAARSA